MIRFIASSRERGTNACAISFIVAFSSQFAPSSGELSSPFIALAMSLVPLASLVILREAKPTLLSCGTASGTE